MTSCYHLCKLISKMAVLRVNKCYRRSSLFFQVQFVAWIFNNIIPVLFTVYLIFPFITCLVTNSLSSGKISSCPWGRQYSKLGIIKNQYNVLLHTVNTTTALSSCYKAIAGVCLRISVTSLSSYVHNEPGSLVICPCCTLHTCRLAHQVCEASKCGCNITTTGGMFSVSVFKSSEGCFETCN